MIGLTWPRYNWTVFDVSGQFGVILDSFLCLLSVFPVVFLGCLCAFLGHFCVCGALFFEDKFCAALAEPQCCSKFIFKNQGPTNTEMPEKRTEATQKHNRKDRQKTKERIQNDPK